MKTVETLIIELSKLADRHGYQTPVVCEDSSRSPVVDYDPGDPDDLTTPCIYIS